VLLGALLLLLPEMYGVGYPVLGKAVAGGYGIAFLIALLVGKLVACSLTIGIGGSGGVFAPSLFCGAMTGAVFGDVVHAVLPGTGGSLGAYALVGMGAVFAGAARAPITAVVILFELTGEYTIILPLMLAIVLATGVSHLVSRDTVYTRKLLRRGIDIDESADATLRRRPVSDVMIAPPASIRADASLRSVAARFASAGGGSLPVTDAGGRYLGTLAAHDLMDALASASDATVTALTVPTAALGLAAPIGDALKQLDLGADAVPVEDAEGHIVGWVRHREMLAALSA
jgi:CIC family chloride channel protein